MANINQITIDGTTYDIEDTTARSQTSDGLTANVKTALLNCFQNVAWTTSEGQTYYDALYDALYEVTAITLDSTSLTINTIGGTSQLTATTTPSGATVTWTSSDTSIATVSSSGLVTSVAYGSCTITATAGSCTATCSVVVSQATVTSIDAVYTQSGTVYDSASLSDLTSDLVVTATWSDSTTSTVSSSDYTLSGTLSEGTSTITVSYGGCTDTFSVTVSTLTALYSWDFTSSLTDTVQSLEATTNATQSSSGVTFSEAGQYVALTGVYDTNRTYVIDIGTFTKQSPNAYGRVWMVDTDTTTSSGGQGYITTGYGKGGDLFYIGAWETSNIIVSADDDADGSYYENSTVGFYVDSDGYVSVYKDGTLLGTSTTAISKSTGANIYIGSSGTGDYLYDLIVTGYRIYEGNIY